MSSSVRSGSLCETNRTTIRATRAPNTLNARYKALHNTLEARGGREQGGGTKDRMKKNLEQEEWSRKKTRKHPTSQKMRLVQTNFSKNTVIMSNL